MSGTRSIRGTRTRRASRPQNARSAPGAAAALMVLLVTAGPAAAQGGGGSIFTLLDPQGRQLAPGEEVSGELTEQDYLAGGRRVQAWALEAREGEVVRIDMVSDELDTYLYLAGPGIGEMSDDDGGDGVNSRLCVEFPASGTYRVVASSFGEDTGPYRITATGLSSCDEGTGRGAEVTDLTTLDTGGRTLPWDGTETGALTSADPRSFNSPVQAWAIQGRAGETLTIDLVSTEFDAYLTVLGPGLPDWITNDDGAGGCNSRVAVTFPEDGTYRAIVSTISGAGGAFTLRSYRDPPPRQTGRCIPPSRAEAAPTSATVSDLADVGSIQVGAAVTGTLGSATLFRNRPAERRTLEAREGQRLAIEQTSDLIDSYLYFQGPGFDDPLYSDDVDGTLNSRICVTIPEDGTYQVVSAGFGSDDTGPYRLSVTADPEGEICSDFLISLESGFGRLSMEAPSLEPGSDIAGALDPDTDERHPIDGSLVDVYAMEVQAGESRVVDLVSDEFDAYLYVLGPGLPDPILNDDGGGRCNARIDLVAPQSGTYQVVVNSWVENGAGAYNLRVSREAGPLAEGSCAGALTSAQTSVSGLAAGTFDHIRPESGRTFAVGTEVIGTLQGSDPTVDDGSYAQAWALEVRAGQTVVVELLSEEFDPYMYVTGPGINGVLADDDGGPGTNSRIQFTPSSDGTYRVIVSTYGTESTGSFRLRALRQVGQ